jgi:hypothetical protein
VFKSDDGTLHLSEAGELREITKVELNEMFGAGEGEEFHIRQLAVPGNGHLELDESTDNWTVDESAVYKLRQIKESSVDAEPADRDVRDRTGNELRYGP